MLTALAIVWPIVFAGVLLLWAAVVLGRRYLTPVQQYAAKGLAFWAGLLALLLFAWFVGDSPNY